MQNSKHGAGHAVKCLCWPCPATFMFCFSRHQSWHFVSLRPETRDVATRVSERNWVQTMELVILKGSFCNLCALAIGLALHILATQCWQVPRRTKQLSTVAILLYRFLSCWCLETSFTKYQPCSLLFVFIHFFWLIRSLHGRSYVGGVYRMRSLAVSGFYLPYPVYDQNDWKTIPFGAAHTYITHIR